MNDPRAEPRNCRNALLADTFVHEDYSLCPDHVGAGGDRASVIAVRRTADRHLFCDRTYGRGIQVRERDGVAELGVRLLENEVQDSKRTAQRFEAAEAKPPALILDEQFCNAQLRCEMG
jgi:hypothetical protein